MVSVLAFIMAGGAGERLEILTKERAKGAVVFGGPYRLIDFPATNVVDSGIPYIMIATQNMPGSIERHVGTGLIYDRNGDDRILEVLHPYVKWGKIIQTKGTADSVRKNINRINNSNQDIVLVLNADNIYKMTYNAFIEQHVKTKPEMTIMVTPVPENRVRDLGILNIDNNGKILGFAEKPKAENPDEKKIIDKFRLSESMKKHWGITDPNLSFLASTGTYAFNRDKLDKIITNYKGTDFGKHIIPRLKRDGGSLYAYVFNGYWRDVGKIRDFFDCNMEWAENTPQEFQNARIRTHRRDLPGAHYFGATLENVIDSPGDIIHNGSTLRNCVMGYQVEISKDSSLDHCILLGADRNEPTRIYKTVIGDNSSISFAILDKNVQIGKGVKINPKYGTIKERTEQLQSIGLKPYKKLNDNSIEGDFSIEGPILVLRKQSYGEKLLLPDGFEC